MSVEKIVADFETCKKAVEIGLKLNTVFIYSTTPEGFVYIAQNINGFWSDSPRAVPAPTAEEVPLPTINTQIGDKPFIGTFISVSGTTICTINPFTEEESEIVSVSDYPNEATARLSAAILNIKNNPKIRRWYINRGYLRAVQEVSHDT